MTTFPHLFSALILTGLCLGGALHDDALPIEADAGAVKTDDGEAPRDTPSDLTSENGLRNAEAEAAAKQRDKLVDDAILALDRTQAALDALEEGDTEAAIEALAIAVGKLDLAIARNPSLALAPIDVRVVRHDLYADVEAVKAARERAEELLGDGHIQAARVLLEGLRSELVVETWSVPLATYPAAIKAVTPLIDRGELDKARLSLEMALNTLVITEQVRPLPVLRARELLRRAEELAETVERESDQTEELGAALDSAREQLELAQALGYGEEEDFDNFYEQLDEIVERTGDGKSGSGFFDQIKSSLRAFGGSSESKG